MKSHVTTIASMLESDTEYVIPQFQRAYAWRREDQWEPLWDDIQNVAKNIANAPDLESVPPHFMGPIVMQQRNDWKQDRESYIIVDGQQRLTTIIIILRAFANASKECNLEGLEDRFLSYVQNDDGQAYSPKVRHLNRRNYNDLKAVLEMFSVGTDVNSMMSQCHDFFEGRAVHYIRAQQEGSAEQNCRNLLDVLLYKLETAVLILDSSEQPNKVFETLNARAEPLRQSELIKNTIMYEGNVIEDEDRANVLWGEQMEHPFYDRETEEGKQLDQFFRDWLTSVNKIRTMPDRASTEFRQHLTTAKTRGLNIDPVTQGMKRAAEIYRKVRENDFPQTQPSTTRLLAAGTGFFMPAVLWLWSEEREIEMAQRQAVLRIIESYIVRRILTGLSVGESMARNIVTMLNAMQYRLDSDAAPQEAAFELASNNRNEANRWPSDAEVKERIGNHPHDMNAARRNMVLHAIESHLRLRQGLPPVYDKLQPVTLIPDGETGMKSFPIEGRLTPARRERRNQVVKMLGNWTLTDSRMNQKEQSMAWEEKQEILERRGRDVWMNQSMRKHIKVAFTEQDVVDRSKWMADLCVAIWPKEQS